MKTRTLSHRAALVSARATRKLTRIRRTIAVGHMDGYVVGIGHDFVLILLVSDLITYNGFEALRLKDIESVEIPSPYVKFIQSALALRRLKKPRSPKVNLDSTANVVRSAAARFPLVTIHYEIADPDVCLIGTPASIGKSILKLRSITPNAEWQEELDSVRMSDITRVSFGGSYEEALALVDAAKTTARS